ncbi:MAG: TatD family hydrolase [Armatimonadetes bacterium]|nr:TatD family hydrolase [Armatimonadota bacterium]
MALIDSHAHLNDPRFAPDRPAVLERARLAGVTGIINVGYDLPSSRLAAEMAEREPDCWAVVGVHPHDAALVNDSVLADLRNMAQGSKVVGIGESGLDYFRNLAPPEVQQQVFARFIHLAADLDLPLVVHCRDAQDDVLRLLDEHATGEQRVIMHCFAGGLSFARACVDRGYWLGLAGTLTYPKAHGLREVAATVPPDRLLVETDCPWLPPQGHRGQRNEPAYVAEVAERLAVVRGLTIQAVGEMTAANVAAAFGLPPH